MKKGKYLILIHDSDKFATCPRLFSCRHPANPPFCKVTCRRSRTSRTLAKLRAAKQQQQADAHPVTKHIDRNGRALLRLRHVQWRGTCLFFFVRQHHSHYIIHLIEGIRHECGRRRKRGSRLAVAVVGCCEHPGRSFRRIVHSNVEVKPPPLWGTRRQIHGRCA